MSTFWKIVCLVLGLSALWLCVWLYPRLAATGEMVATAPRLVGSLDSSGDSATMPTSGSSRSSINSRFVYSRLPSASTTGVDGFRFERFIISPIDYPPGQVVVGDVTGDRRNDIVVTLNNWMDLRLRIHVQKSDGTLANPLEYKVMSAWGTRSGLELVDLDQDGLPEIVAGSGGGLAVFRRIQGAFVETSYPGHVGAYYLGAVDADGDGLKDIFAQSWGDGADLYLSNGVGGIREVRHISTQPNGYNTVEVSDFTADGLADVAVTNGQGWSKVWIFPFRVSAGLQIPLEIDLPSVQKSPPWGMTVADMDQDGRPDLVVSDLGNDIDPRGIHIFYRGAGNTISRHAFLVLEGVYQRPGATAVADVDGNGYPDIVTMLNGYDQMTYFLQDADGFAPAVAQSTDDNLWTNSSYDDNSFVIADVNSDRCPDVVLAEASSSLRIFYGRNCRLASMRTGGKNLPRRR